MTEIYTLSHPSFPGTVIYTYSGGIIESLRFEGDFTEMARRWFMSYSATTPERLKRIPIKNVNIEKQ